MKSETESVDYCIGAALAKVAADNPDRIGLVEKLARGYQEHSFAELGQESEQYGAALQQAGLGVGDRVLLMVRPSKAFVCLTFALFRLGAVVILIDPGMGYRNLLRCTGKVKPDWLIGIPLVLLLSRLYPRPFRTVRQRISVGTGLFGLLGKSLTQLVKGKALAMLATRFQPHCAAQEDLAAIIFTTGSTGPPKGVQYTHGIFHAQLRLIRQHYQITTQDVDQPCFPLFALFSTALGVRTVIPVMNPAKPGQVKPAKFIETLIAQKVTYSFGSPTIWRVISDYCLKHQIQLPIRKILMAGAPVSGELLARVKKIMAPGGEIHTPYGATESLPISSCTDQEILGETWELSKAGKGTCVGTPLPGIDIQVIAAVDGVIASWNEVVPYAVERIGEIVVRGPVVTRAYDHDEEETAQAKIFCDEGFYHRVGDMGYYDRLGRLWFCGRKAHRVFTSQGVLYTIPCEAIFNQHAQVARSALVGIGEAGQQQPILIVEPLAGEKIQGHDQACLFQELRRLAVKYPHTEEIATFLIHPAFPVDIRHNAKIFREKLAVWASQQLAKG